MQLGKKVTSDEKPDAQPFYTSHPPVQVEVVTFAFKKPKGKILITSALPYVNNVPHLGNIIGCTLSGDVFSRYCKHRGWDALYVCGTDEHGTATETKAIEEGLTPQEICDKYYAIHKDIYEWFDIQFDLFGRTSTKEHERIVQDIFLDTKKNGFIIEKMVEQLYCETCKKFLADRYVEGTCPHCQYANARGDQCENCGHLLNAVELIKPACKICGSSPVIRESEHLFLDLEKLQKELSKWVEKTKQGGFWTENAITTTEKWLKEGLKPRAISRDLTWGVPIPLEKFKGKVFYVWFDAPIGYISITAKDREDWKDWWQAKDVKLYQFMGKDNIPFHTIVFPATLLATKKHWTMLHHINATEYLNYEEGKFSKSRGVGVFGDDAMQTGIPADVWRYYLLANRPEGADTTFTWKEFQDRNNNELVANLGNLVNRTVTFISKYQDGKVAKAKKKDLESKEHVKKIQGHFDAIELKKALQEIMGMSKAGNKYFQDKAPWKLIKEDPDECKNVLANLYAYIRDLAIVVAPFLPETARKMQTQLNYGPLSWESIGKPCDAATIGTPDLLFAKLEDERIAGLKASFSGKKETMHDQPASTTSASPAPVPPSTKENTPTTHSALPAETGQTTAGNEDDLFAMLGLKVAEIIEVAPHPKADKLYLLQVDIGEGEPRQLVAGIRPHYTEDELRGKKIVVVSNLEPAVLRGERSEGMLLAAGNPDGTEVGLLLARTAPNGSPVFTATMKAAVLSARPSGKVPYADFAKLTLEARGKRAYFNGEELTAGDECLHVDKDVEGKLR